MQKFLRLEFLPTNADLGLLVLRVILGASMLWLHGWGKLLNLVNGRTSFENILGLGSTPSLVLAVFAEFLCAAFVVLGAFTRMAALMLVITMGVAFFLVHGHQLTGPQSGEMSFLFFAGFLALFFAGAGKYSVDRK